MELVEKSTKWVIRILILLLLCMLLYALVEFLFLAGRAMLLRQEAFSFSATPIDRDKLFFNELQGFIAAILLLTILIELIASLIEYLKLGSTNYVKVINEIALIATIRHLLALDFEHINPLVLVGLAALILVLGLFYFMATKTIHIGINKSSENP
jgi:uncharacterized membrane protein (DUF373 family)